MAARIFRLLCDVGALEDARRAVLWRPLGPWQAPATAPQKLPSPHRLSVARIAERAGGLERGGRGGRGRGAPLSGRNREVKGLKAVLAHSQQRLAAVVAAAAAAVDAKQDHGAGHKGHAEVLTGFPSFARLHKASAPQSTALRPRSPQHSSLPPPVDSVDLLAFDEEPQQLQGGGEGALLEQLLTATGPDPAEAAEEQTGGPDPWDTAGVGNAFSSSREASTRPAEGGAAASAGARGAAALDGWSAAPSDGGDLLHFASQSPTTAPTELWGSRPGVDRFPSADAAAASGGGTRETSVDPFSPATATAFGNSQERVSSAEAWLWPEEGRGRAHEAEGTGTGAAVQRDDGGTGELGPNPPSRPTSPGASDLIDLLSPSYPAMGGESEVAPLAVPSAPVPRHSTPPAPAAVSAASDAFVAVQAVDPFSLAAVEAFSISGAGGSGSDGALDFFSQSTGVFQQEAAFDPFS